MEFIIIIGMNPIVFSGISSVKTMVCLVVCMFFVLIVIPISFLASGEYKKLEDVKGVYV